ncbi:hypothetical protein AVEN_242980-1 [Araneus ventricosus]|uniref:Uncharacterized protein n=1 Tax=Araneus ventricosus TaxID=182803 RepID=A0A4Y2D2V1_ARAVE|nr:hypothetical protein AVEN_242980-1 [Araneus ventricosus]
MLGEFVDKTLEYFTNPGGCQLLYSEKMYDFIKRLEYYNGKIEKLYQIYLFCPLIFVKVWLNSLKTADAPVNDLMLWESLNLYEKYDPGVDPAALLTFSRHLRYLTGEAVTFSLFSKKVSNFEKKTISASLMKCIANEQ